MANKGLKAGNRKIKTTQKIDLKAPSYKWLICRKCLLNEVKVSVEAIGCVCAYCLTIVCDYTPNIPKLKTVRRKKKPVMSTFAKNELKAKKQAALAENFKNKKNAIKNGNGIVKKFKKRKSTKKKANVNI